MSRDHRWWSGDSGWWGMPSLAALVQQSEVNDNMEDGDGRRPRTRWQRGGSAGKGVLRQRIQEDWVGKARGWGDHEQTHSIEEERVASTRWWRLLYLMPLWAVQDVGAAKFRGPGCYTTPHCSQAKGSFTVDHTTRWWYAIYDFFCKGK
jgi:hypothetical protein